MKKVLFFSFPASGHVNSSLELCEELAKHDIVFKYVTFKEYFQKFKYIDNIQMVDYCEEFRNYYFDNEERSGQIKANLIALLNMLYTMTNILCPFVYDLIQKEKPDLLICDPFIIAAKMAAKAKNVEYSLFFSLLVQNPVGNKMPPGILKTILRHPILLGKTIGLSKDINKRYGEFCDEPGDLLSHQGVKTIVTTAMEFHPYGDLYPENVYFAGPINREVELKEKDEKLIFLSMGTIESNAPAIEAFIDIVGQTDYKLVVTLANNKQIKIDRSKLPKNVIIYDNLTPTEYRSMIARAILFINSGGINSVSEAILSLTPMLICPSSQETHDMGVLVQKYHCGILYDHKHIKTDLLKKAAKTVLTDRTTTNGLKTYRKYLLNSMGFAKAADELLKNL